MTLRKPLCNAKICQPEPSQLFLQVVEKIPAVMKNKSEVSWRTVYSYSVVRFFDQYQIFNMKLSYKEYPDRVM